MEEARIKAPEIQGQLSGGLTWCHHSARATNSATTAEADDPRARAVCSSLVRADTGSRRVIRPVGSPYLAAFRFPRGAPRVALSAAITIHLLP